MKTQGKNWVIILVAAVVCVSICAAPKSESATAISLNFNSNQLGPATAVGANSAGVVFVPNWNDLPQFSETGMTLHDSANMVVPLTLTMPPYAYSVAFPNFPNPGDDAMMDGHVYNAGGNNLDLFFNGTIPYAYYEIYLYYNSGGQNNTQTFSILNSLGGSLGLSQTGHELPGTDTAYVLSTGANNANYIRFTDLTSASIPASFIIRSTGTATTGGNQYSYFNGIQFVEAVPEPSTAWLMGLTGVWFWWRRK